MSPLSEKCEGRPRPVYPWSAFATCFFANRSALGEALRSAQSDPTGDHGAQRCAPAESLRAQMATITVRRLRVIKADSRCRSF